MQSICNKSVKNTLNVLKRESLLPREARRGFLSQFAPNHQYTKYKIVRPFMNANSEWEDALISEPESDRLVKFNKTVPVFLRFLKLVCDQESRQKDFVEFAKRCESGLVVQEGAYITKNELLAIMDKNGYSPSEVTAYALAFPDDYKFHYPELAIAFDLAEEDTYKFCMRTRMNSQEIVQVKYDKTPGFLSTFIATYVSIGGALANPMGLAHYAFVGKIIPYYLTIALMWRSFGPGILAENKQAMAEIDRAHSRIRLEGQEKILERTAKFAEDTNSVQYLNDFKSVTQKKLGHYRSSIINSYRQSLNDKMLRQLNSIRNAEKVASSGLQDLMSKEIINSFKLNYDTIMAQQAFEAAIQGIKGQDVTTDPVKNYILKSLNEFNKIDLASGKAKADGTIIERVAYAHQSREKEFLSNYTVTKAEANEINSLNKACNGDVSKLNNTQIDRLDALFRDIHERLGFATITEKEIEQLHIDLDDQQARDLIQKTNQNIDNIKKTIRNQRLNSFLAKF